MINDQDELWIFGSNNILLNNITVNQMQLVDTNVKWVSGDLNFLFYIKNDGTLWFIGTYVYFMAGVRQHTPVQVGIDLWKDIDVSLNNSPGTNNIVAGIKQDGTLWVIGRRTQLQNDLFVIMPPDGDVTNFHQYTTHNDYIKVRGNRAWNTGLYLIRNNHTIWFIGIRTAAIIPNTTPLNIIDFFQVDNSTDNADVITNSEINVGNIILIKQNGDVQQAGIQWEANREEFTPLQWISYSVPAYSSQLNWNWLAPASYNLDWKYNGIKSLHITGNNGTARLAINGKIFDTNGDWLCVNGIWLDLQKLASVQADT